MSKRVTAIEVTFKVVRDRKSDQGTIINVLTPTVRFDGKDIKGKIRQSDSFWLSKAYTAWRKHRNIPDDEKLTPKDVCVSRLHDGE